jgi:aminodeoxyfutalosine deaminase
MSGCNRTMGEGANRIRIHRAAWVLPVERPPIPDGAVVADGDTLIGVGTYRDLKARFPSGSLLVDHGDDALMPAVVNGHTHLELTALEGSIPLPQEGFPSWIQQVFRHRAGLDAASAQAGFRRGLLMLRASGVALCGDITNSGSTLSETVARCPGRLTFLELIGFDCDSLAGALDITVHGASSPSDLQGDGMSLAAHAVYSTSAPVIQQAKNWCRAGGKVFSMHVSEHEPEMEFLRTGGGYCRELLTALGRWVEGWVPPGGSPVAYLDTLGVLDARTLLVHAVHMSSPDWETVASRGCAVCFCPRSNHYLGSGKADVNRAIRMGIPAALGTDSLASNRDLNLFAEGAFLLDHWPDATPDAVLTMMTLGGARALGCQNRFGRLAPGKYAAVLAIPAGPDVPVGRLSETIIHKAREGAVQWALGPENA